MSLASYVRLLCGFMICFGLTFGLGLIHTAYVGQMYSGIARRRVTREHDPRHFWILLATIAALPLLIIAYGVYEFAGA